MDNHYIDPDEYEQLVRANEAAKEEEWCRQNRLNKMDYRKLQIQFDKTPDPSEASASAEHMIAMHLLNQLGHRTNSRGEAWKLMQRLLACGPLED